MATVIVTGGAGFIGSAFVRLALAKTDYDVVVVDKLTYAGSKETLKDLTLQFGSREVPVAVPYGAEALPPRLIFEEADIADRERMRALFREKAPRAVVNFAAETHVDRSIDDPSAFVRTNVLGTFELLEAARLHLRERPDGAFRFLHVSTDEVYGTLGPDGAFSETTAYAPNSPYAASKAGADHLVRAWHETYRLPAILTNCSNNYGPFQFPEKLIPLMILNAAEGKPLPIYGDGGNVRDWLFVDDHCEGILLALTKGRPGEKYNIGGGNERTNREVVDALCAILDRELPPAKNRALAGRKSYAELKTFVTDRPGHDRRYAIDAGKIRAELGWRPKHDFEARLAETVRWYLANRAWCEAVQRGGHGRERLGLGERA